MSTFQIGESPSKIYLGEQPQVTLVNQGPFSVFLSEDPGGSRINGFELPPTGQMTWKPEKELWAVCPRIPGQFPGFEASARLQTLAAGELSLTTRAKFFQPLWSGEMSVGIGGGLNSTPILEVGHCATVLMKRVTNASVTEFLTAYAISWFDDNGAVLVIERGTWYSGPTNPFGDTVPTLRVRIPVRGRFMQITAGGIAGGSGAGLTTITGTDLPLDYCAMGGIFLTGLAGAINYNGNLAPDEWRAVNWNQPAGDIFLPGMNGQLRVFVLNNSAGVIGIGLYVNPETQPHDFLVAQAGQGVVQTFLYSPREAVKLSSFGVAGGTPLQLRCSWLNYQ